MKKAFTLIELLIVVAIIAILAAIAVPNFLEAQVRAKVSRTKADLRSLATAIEAYAVDNNKYFPPIDGVRARAASPGLFYGGNISYVGGPATTNQSVSARFVWITTPIAYISSIFPEVFAVQGVAAGSAVSDPRGYDTFDYWTDAAPTNLAGTSFIVEGSALSSGCTWRVASVGPDRFGSFGGTAATGGRADAVTNNRGWSYDPTNGTVSNGDVLRCGGQSRRGDGTLAFHDRGLNPSL